MLHTTAHLAVIALRLLLLRGSCFDFPGLSRFCPLHSGTPYRRFTALPPLLVFIFVRLDYARLAFWFFWRDPPAFALALLFWLPSLLLFFPRPLASLLPPLFPPPLPF